MANRELVAPRQRLAAGRLTLAAAMVACANQALPFQIDTANPDFSRRWDNTVKYSAAWRMSDRSSKLSEGQVARNQDDGDRAFGRHRLGGLGLAHRTQPDAAGGDDCPEPGAQSQKVAA